MNRSPRSDRRAAMNGRRSRAFFGATRGVVAGLLVASVLVAGAGPVRADDLPAILHAIFGSTPDDTPPETPSTLVVAGDIASCDVDHDEATAKLLDGLAGTVATLGDNAYDSGSSVEFAECYGPTWGRHKSRTRPTPGNHEYETDGASGYFGYFGDAATPLDPGCRSDCRGYYSYDLGNWHVIVLNSECIRVPGGCGDGSPQEQWLRAELAAHPGCQIVATHHPRWSSDSNHGSDRTMQAFWRAAADADVELYLAGHAHDYERFDPMDGNGNAISTGVRQFVVGTGGSGLHSINDPIANSAKHNDSAHGVLELTLYSDRYEWSFVPVEGQSFTDSGEDTCH